MRITLLLAIIIFPAFVFSQKIPISQFKKSEFLCEFNNGEDITKWPMLNSVNTIAVFSGGYYVIDRKNPQIAEKIFPTFINNSNTYEIQVIFTCSGLQKSENTIGICFGFDKDIRTGYLLEINRNKQFCVRYLAPDGTSIYFTGAGTKKYWMSFPYILDQNQHNVISIFTDGNVYDIYINNHFAFTFNNQYILNNKAGLFIGPLTTLSVDKFEIKFPAVTESSNAENGDVEIVDDIVVKPVQQPANVNKPDTAVAGDLLRNYTELKNKYNELLKQMNKCKEDNNKLHDFINENLDEKTQQRMKLLEEENDKLKKSNRQLQSQYNNFVKYKNYYEKLSKNTDLFKYLNKELNKSELNRLYLLEQIKKLEQELSRYKKKK